MSMKLQLELWNVNDSIIAIGNAITIGIGNVNEITIGIGKVNGIATGIGIFNEIIIGWECQCNYYWNCECE